MVQYPIRGSNANAIAASAEHGLAAGVLTPGQQMPTVRGLAGQLSVSPATVAAAYRILKLRGIIRGSGRRGTVVNPVPPLVTRFAPPVASNVRNLAAGGPDPAQLPPLPRSLPRAFSRHGYGEPYNRSDLLKLAAQMFDADGIRAGPIAVTSGALDAIERLLQANLRVGDRVAVEDPGYPPVLDLVAALGLRAEPFRIDNSGPLPDEFSRILKGGVEAAIITPRAQNPTGAALDRERVHELRRILKPHPHVMLIEDDHAGPVAGAPALTMCESVRPRWAIVRSLSKSLGPDLRLALVTGDEMSISRLEGRQRLGPGWVSHLLQELAIALWADPNTQRLVNKAAETYAQRRRALLDATEPIMRAEGIETVQRLLDARNGIIEPPELAALLRTRFLRSSTVGLLGMATGLRTEPNRVAELAAALRTNAIPCLVAFGESDDVRELIRFIETAERGIVK